MASLTDEELRQNFYEMCCLYATLNGTTRVSITESTASFVLANAPPTEIPTIAVWNHDSPQPSNNDLRSLSLANARANMDKIESVSRLERGNDSRLVTLLFNMNNSIRQLQSRPALTREQFLDTYGNLS
jgi:hypothetical protein